MYEKHNAFFYVDKTRKWHHLGYSKNAALEAYKVLCAELATIASPTDDVEYLRDFTKPSDAYLARVLQKIKQNARQREIPVELTIPELRTLYEESGGYCAVTGIKFHGHPDIRMADKKNKRKRLWLASVDRIDSGQGYTAGNVRLVCAAVNIAMQDFGEDVLLKIARGLIQTRRRTQQASF